MRMVRLPFCVFALIVILILSACSSTVAETPQLHTEHANDGSTVTPTILATATQPGNTKTDPIRLVVPAVGVNAFVEMVGIRSDGELAVPAQNPWEDVGWYGLGPHPGERGSAVIDGHLDRPGGYPAVFWRLRNVQVGNDVQVMNSAGKTLHFRVTRIAYYTPDQAPLQDIFGNLGGTYLNLITCAGDWIPNQHQTTLRLVVYTTLV